MTQGELELIARNVRARGLHSSWDDLLKFSKDVIGNLADAYQSLLKSLALSKKTPSNDLVDMQKVIRDKLATALTLLTSPAQVARWESEALAENHILAAEEAENPRIRRQSA